MTKIFSFGTGLGVFTATLGLTLLGAARVLRHTSVYQPSDSVDFWWLLFLFLLATSLLLLFLRLVRGRLLFTLFFSLAMFAGVWFAADIFLPNSWAVIFAAGLLFVRYLFPRVIIQNLLVIIGLAGVAISLGLSVSWQAWMMISALLAVYDILAVYGTGHMITIMKGLLARGVIFAAILPEARHGTFERLDRVRPGEGFMLVGTGDFALPATFVSALAVQDIILAFGAAVGALLGFALTTLLFLGPDQAKPMPALPPIVLGMILGFLVSFLAGKF